MTHKAQGLTLDGYPAIKRWYVLVSAREAAQGGLAPGKEWRQKMDEEACNYLFGTDKKRN